jgi:hypothetical protein
MIKKSISLVLVFGLLFSIFVFYGLLTKSLLLDYIIKPISEEGKKINQDDITNKEIDNAIQTYSNWNLPYDILFLFFWLIMEISLIYSAINSTKLPNFDFMSLLFFGILIIFLIFNLISQITTWFYTEFISNIFETQTLSIYTWYMNNHGIIVLINIFLVLILNQLFGKDKKLEGVTI